ncbi:MAG TPA: hypothetical protein VLV87_04080 [Gammaproteobacteria bacterium]|nr:hypothetical protein [Gammaproteobacteria bacterium]
MALELTAEELSRNPAWHLYDLDVQRGEMRFLEARPETFRVSAFLDTRIAYTGDQVYGFPLDAIAGALQQHPPPRRELGLLFHTSFCCSSLLARSLQREHRTLVLREPWVLRRLGDLKRGVQARRQAWYPQGPALLDMALQLLTKTWEESEAVLIKPTNVSNNLAEDILSLRPDAMGLVLTSDLESFLISNLKKTDETRQKLPAMVQLVDQDVRYGEQLGISLADLSFLQSVVVVWHAQRMQWQTLLASSAGDRLRSLDSAELLAHPAETLTAAAAFLGRPLDVAEALDIAAGPVWNTHAKDPFSAYDSGRRDSENRDLLGQHRQEISEALRWAERLLSRRSPELGRPLMS